MNLDKIFSNAAIKQNTLHSISDNSLIIGNGDLNGVVYSQGENIIIRIVKNDILDARIDTSKDPELLKIDIKNRKLSRDVNISPSSWDNPYPCPILCGEIIIGEPPLVKNKFSKFLSLFKKQQHPAYCSELNIRSAAVKVDFQSEMLNEQIEVRLLADKNAILVKTKQQIHLEREKIFFIPDIQNGITEGVEWITQDLPSDPDWQGVKYTIALNQTEQFAIITLVNSLESDNYHKEAISLAKRYASMAEESLIKTHEKVWEEFWSKSNVSLEDEFLTNLWYQNLYFLRCIAKKGVKAAGLFAGYFKTIPMWHGAHTLNYNSQQTFWAAYSSNHPEMGDPYEQMILNYLPRGKWYANQTYGIKGAFYPHNLFTHEPSDPTLCKSNIKRMHAFAPYAHTIGLSGHIVHNLWQHYLLYPDEVFLKQTAYPVLREFAQFYSEFIANCRSTSDGKVELGPSYSPEHWWLTPDFKNNFNCTYDIAFIQFVFKSAIQAGPIINEDQKTLQEWSLALKQLPAYPTTQEINPVVVDVKGAKPIKYNITVPTIPIFPANQITWFSPSEEKILFKRTIEQIKWNGNNAMVMLAIAKARLSIAGTYHWFNEEINVRLRPNRTLRLNRLRPKQEFNSFGHYSEQFAVTGVINELLLQSVGGILRIFPAWPENLDGEFKNLRAQGGFEVSAIKRNKKINTITIKATVNQSLRLLSPWKKNHYQDQTSKCREIELNGDQIFEIIMNEGDCITISEGK